jgi:Fe2+ transport system protein FeoA
MAPLGDPVEFEVMGYSLSLRKSEAREITVELLPEARP